MAKKKKKFSLLGWLVLLIALSVPFTAADIWFYGTKDERTNADVIIVLGAAAYESGVAPVFAERINHAANLYKEGYADNVILTGGVAEGNHISDAEIASYYAEEVGISPDDLYLEELSSVTLENLRYSKEIMDENGFETAIIVSDPLHMKRAMVMAKDCGIQAYSSPTPSSRYITLSTQLPFLWRETYTLIGYMLAHIFSVGGF